MKILYHHRTASKDGQDVHISEMIAAMRRQGHQVTVVGPAAAASFGDDGGLAAKLKARLPATLYELLELAYSLLAFGKLCRAVLGERPDFLYERCNVFCLAGLWASRCFGLPFILEVNSPLAAERAAHGGLRLKRLAQWSETAVWRGADLVLPVTAVLARLLRQQGVPEKNLMVVHNGIDPARFRQPLESARRHYGLENRVILGFVGFIRDWHGLPRVIDGMAALPERTDLHLLVVGDGPGLAPLKDYAAAKGMSDRLTCCGLVGRDAIAGLVASFDIALQPRVVPYASPLKLFEYMALSRAILAPDQANIREIVTDEVDALLFDPEDDADFQRQLNRLFQDAPLRARLGAAAAATIVAKQFTWDDNVRRVVAAVQALPS